MPSTEIIKFLLSLHLFTLFYIAHPTQTTHPQPPQFPNDQDLQNLISNINNTIDETVQKRVSSIAADLKQQLSALDGDYSAEANLKREKILKEAQTKLKQEIMNDLKNDTLKQFLNSTVSLQQLNSILDQPQVQSVLKEWAKAAGVKDAQNWNITKEIDAQVSALFDTQNDEIDKLINKQIEDIVTQIANNEDQVQNSTKTLITTLQTQLLSDEKIKQALTNLYDNPDNFDAGQDIIDFNIDALQDEIKNTINDIGDEYDTLSTIEKQELADFIIVSNENVGILFNKITDDDIKERLFVRLRNIVLNQLKNGTRDYDLLMSLIDTQIDLVEDDQLSLFDSEEIIMRSPYSLGPSQQFTFSIEDLLVNQRDDVDFFEFVTVEAKFETDSEDI